MLFDGPTSAKSIVEWAKPNAWLGYSDRLYISRDGDPEHVLLGFWVVRDADGDLHLCSPDKFESEYEAAG